MNRAEPCAREHREDRFGHARHVDDDAVAFFQPERLQRSGEPRNLVAQLGVGDGPHDAGDRTVVDDRALLAPSPFDVAVDGVVAGVHHPAGKPADERRRGCRRGHDPSAGPGNTLSGLPPRSLRGPRATGGRRFCNRWMLIILMSAPNDSAKLRIDGTFTRGLMSPSCERPSGCCSPSSC